MEQEERFSGSKLEFLLKEVKDISLKALTDADVPVMVELAKAQGIELDTGKVTASIQDKSLLAVGAFVGERLAGFSSAHEATPSKEGEAPASVHLDIPVVAPQQRGRKMLYMVLFIHLLEVLRDRGIPRVYVMVLNKKKELINRFLGLGFLPTSENQIDNEQYLTLSFRLADFERTLGRFPCALAFLDKQLLENSLLDSLAREGETIDGLGKEWASSKPDLDAFTPSLTLKKSQCPNELTCNPGYCETACIYPVCNFDCIASCVACVDCLVCVAPSACATCLTSCMENCVVCISPGAGGSCTVTISSKGESGFPGTQKARQKLEERNKQTDG